MTYLRAILPQSSTRLHGGGGGVSSSVRHREVFCAPLAYVKIREREMRDERHEKAQREEGHRREVKRCAYE